MRKLSIQSEHEVTADPAASPVGLSVAGRRTSRLLTPDGFPLWLHVVDLESGTALTWSEPRPTDGAEDERSPRPQRHSDQAVYVLAGALEIDGQRCAAGGALIVESEAGATATAAGATRVAHFGSWDPRVPIDGPCGAPGQRRDRVHVVGPAGWFTTQPRAEVRSVWFADATCEGCRAALFRVTREGAGPARGRPHTHSQDEVIYVLEGAIRLGSVTCPAGSALSVPADVRYAETSGPEGSVFLNFRRDASTQVYFEADGPTPARLEVALTLGGDEVGDLVTLHTSPET